MTVQSVNYGDGRAEIDGGVHDQPNQSLPPWIVNRGLNLQALFRKGLMVCTPRSHTGAAAITVGLTVTALLVSVVISACAIFPSSAPTDGGAVIPEWQFNWSPVGGSVNAATDPHTAFADAGRAEHVGTSGATEHMPAAVVWLAAGQTFGDVIVQLDPAGRYWNLVTLLIDTRSQTWQAYAGGIPTPTPCGSGKQFTAPSATFGSYCTLEPVQSDAPPSGAVIIWTAPDSRIFIADRIAAAALPPGGAAQMKVFAGYSGWLTQSHGWTVMLALLPSGESAVFAGTSDAEKCQQLGSDFLRLGADPASLR